MVKYRIIEQKRHYYPQWSILGIFWTYYVTFDECGTLNLSFSSLERAQEFVDNLRRPVKKFKPEVVWKSWE
jgi:hypothetical protein